VFREDPRLGTPPTLINQKRPQLFKERLIYEQSAARTVREQQEKRTCLWSRQPLKIEQLGRHNLNAR
jgi:hypothetical protein